MNILQKSNHRLLVSFCNQFVSPECSLAEIDTIENSAQWIFPDIDDSYLSGMQGITGIAQDETRIFALTQGSRPTLIVLCASSLNVQFVKPLALIKDPHSAILYDGKLFTVSTGTNQIFYIKVDGEEPGEEEVYWSYPGVCLSNDVVHLNGITLLGARFIGTCFGPRTEENKWGENGRVFFIDTNETILGNLNNPHTPYVDESTLYVAESKAGTVHRVELGINDRTQVLNPIQIGGYVRGICVKGKDFFVGVSANRLFSRSTGSNLPYNEEARCSRLVKVSLDTMEITDFDGFCLLGDEIYDLLSLPDSLEASMPNLTDAASERLLHIKQLTQNHIHENNFLLNQCNVTQSALDKAYFNLNTLNNELEKTKLIYLHLKTEFDDCTLQIIQKNQEVEKTKHDLGQSQFEVNECNALIEKQRQEIEHLHFNLKNKSVDIDNYRLAMDQILSSRSWKITKPLRSLSGFTKDNLRRLKTLRRLPDLLRATSRRRIYALIRYLIKRDFESISSKLESLLSDIDSIEVRAHIESSEALNLCIITTLHTKFVAHNIADVLYKHGHNVEITTSEPELFDHDFYFVLCPQMFRRLPPGEKRITFQFEQSVSERWFNQDYIEVLRHSFAVFDYSQKNIAYLANRDCAYPHVYYLPIGATMRWASLPLPEKKIQVLFYGDYKSSPRRRMLLDVLEKRFNVERIDNLFGNALREKIRESEIVINLHYYEGALLETTRIQECLSLGVRVVSESSPDVGDYPEFAGVVDFFECGDKASMLKAVEQQLALPFSPENHWEYLRRSEHHFEFMLDRFLFSSGFVDLEKIINSEPEIPFDKDFYAISLPETQHRRKFILSELPHNSYLFDGVRFSPGWVGCALSYIKLFQMAAKHKLPRVTIMEDDVILPENFHAKYQIITEYLDRDPDSWHIFSGLIAVLHPEVRVLKQEVYNGLTFVTIDRMTSMVFNIYNQTILPDLLSWDASKHDADTNTIDKYIEGLVDLKVVVVLPFFAGHREEAHSTLWGIENTHYADLIATTEKKLLELMLEARTRSIEP